MKKILHIITGLGSGGAEHMLYKLLKYSDKEKYYHEVVSLIDKGIYGEKIEELGIEVHCLNLSKNNAFSSLRKTRNIAKKFDIVDTWLYHADIFGFIVAKLLLRKKLIWNIRHSNLDKSANKSSTLKIIKINSILSKYVDIITFNSNKALENHSKFGYIGKKSEVIPNGFELDKFRYSEESRNKVRNSLGLKSSDKVIITVGRWDIQKDYYTLFKALNEINKQDINFKMLMVGSNLDKDNTELMSLVEKYSLMDKVILSGRQNDIPAYLSAADVYVSSSLGESFSNAIGEAMACELPCIVTDVGDSKIMVGYAGRVVKSGDYKEMGAKLGELLISDSLARNIDARNRVFKKYSIEYISGIYADIYNTLYNKEGAKK